MRVIRYSEIATYLKCSQAHDISYNKLIEARHIKPHIELGTFGHLALKHLLLTGSHEEARDAVLELLRDTMQDVDTEQVADEACQVAFRAYEFLGDRFATVFHNGEPLVEKTLTFQFGDIVFQGTPDWVAEDKVLGGVWVFDHKFRKTFRPPESEDTNLQMIFYQGLLQKTLGITTVGTRQFQIKPFAPKLPEMTTKGTMSKANINTDWPTYKLALQSYRLPVDDYLDMKPKLDAKVWFDHERTKAFRPQEEVSRVWREVILPVAERISRQNAPMRVLDYMACRGCLVREYCVEDLKGGDLDFLMKTKYKIRGEKTSDIFVEIEE